MSFLWSGHARSGLLLLALTSFLAVPLSQAQSVRVEVEALFADIAVVKINGQRKTLRVGQSYGGVTLVSASAEIATVQMDGQTHELGLSGRIGSHYARPDEQTISLRRDANMQYQTTAIINGHSTVALVDTGANVVAMNATMAGSLGVDYQAGETARVETAGGMARAWMVTLRSVSVGGINVENVAASVVDGTYPTTVLLGMSYLRHLKMQEHNGVLSLSRAW